MAEQIVLSAKFREDAGKGASRRLRQQGEVPAILYGGRRDARALTLNQRELGRYVNQDSFGSTVITLKVGDLTQEAICKSVQRHPAQHSIVHIDFQRIMSDEKIRMEVPLKFIGEEEAVGVKAGGVVSRIQAEVEITCLPRDLPAFLEVDVTALGMNEMLHLSDIKLPNGVEILALAQGEDHDQAIVAINPPRAEEVDVAPAEVVAADAVPAIEAAVPTEESEKDSKDNKDKGKGKKE